MVYLGNDPVSAVRPIGGNRRLRSFRGRVATGRIGEPPTLPLLVLAGNDDAGLVGQSAGGRGRIDRHHHPGQGWCSLCPGRLDDATRPQGTRHVVEKLGLDLLAAEARPFVFADDLIEKAGARLARFS